MSARPNPFPFAPFPIWTEAADQWFKAYRAGFETLLSMTNAALAGIERTHLAQIGADVEAQTQNREAALAAGKVSDLNGLLALQARLFQAYADSALRYWSTCAELARQTGDEMARAMAARAADWQRALRPGEPAAADTAEAAPQRHAEAA
jgi:hypothetical protein